ncbi:MAG TPA: CehA/McbA family metallohydrolase, partial [Pirellulaceae bacterium]|nr:CehA/McbA family metallohydrolase [Pirellulaceae bacterium]
MRSLPKLQSLVLIAGLLASAAIADDALPVVSVEGQPLAANVRRIVQAFAHLGQPLPADLSAAIETAARDRDHARLQTLLDQRVLLVVAINPESRVKVLRGPAAAVLQQGGFTPVVVKVINESTITKRLKVVSPQAGPVYAGAAPLSLQRQQQVELGENPNKTGDTERFLGLEMFAAPPMTDKLSGLEVEYAIALIYCHEAGKREATIGFDVEQGNQDLGFRGEVPVLFDVKPAVNVRLAISDDDGKPTIGKLVFRDAQGHIYPPQAKRLAPDLFFQPHVYRASGETVLLPPGKFTVQFSRGPEYRVLSRDVEVPTAASFALDLKLERWIDTAALGYYSGDHHIHAAGCAHYTNPTEGISPDDMFRQVKGEGLNVGAVLTWGPCFRYQRQFFQPKPSDLSESLTVLKYDLEISGFGSQALGHVCLLNLNDQTYPGSGGLETEGWPTWTVPVLRWCKEQGGVTGYAHSASGLWIDEKNASQRLLKRLDASGEGELSASETAEALLPESFEMIDADKSGSLSSAELIASHARAAEQLPNLAIPEMNGVGAMELPVSVAEGVCDFISAMDTRRIQEWNTWYHLLNCGFPLKASGETDFPCMSSRNVGQGRTYVRLGQVEKLDYAAWCEGIRAGRSYVSDGYAHAVEFQVTGARSGEQDVKLPGPGRVKITTRVAFAAEVPLAVAYGGITPPTGRRMVGDTVDLHGRRHDEEMVRGGKRLVEIIVNGQ